MYHVLLRDASFWTFLFEADKKLAHEACQQGCPCGGRLHSANYPRKPRGGGENLPESYTCRLSFCCDRDGCRKRTTPPSVRFLGRKVYLAAVVVLVAAMRHGPSPRRVRELTEMFGADRCTIAGWGTFSPRALSSNPVLEGTPLSLHADASYGRLSTGAVRYVHPARGFPRRLEAIAGVSLADHGHRGPGDQGNFLKAPGPQKMIVERLRRCGYTCSHGRFYHRVLDS